MSYGNRHFGKINSSNEEIVIMGYREKTNDVLVVVLAALQQQEAQDLRAIVSAETAQKKDYLMDTVGGNILASVQHPSGTDWQEYLLKLGERRGGNGVIRKLSLNDVTLFDGAQKRFFAGYGESIEPEIDKLRKSRITAQENALTGRSTLPEPSREEVEAALARQRAAEAEDVANKASVAEETVDPNAALVAALAAIAQGQQAIIEKLDAVGETKPKRKATTRRSTTKKSTSKRKPVKAAKPEAAEATVVEPEAVAVPVDDTDVAEPADAT